MTNSVTASYFRLPMSPAGPSDLVAGCCPTRSETPVGERPQPKYLNSPESALYKKGALLYGLFQAKEPIRETGRALVVEGYTDLISLVQRGFRETVAVLGTALTLEQLRLLKRFSTDIYIFFDGDEAGRRAATRAFPLCVEAGLTGRGVFLPQGEDPDSFGQAQGREGLEALIDTAAPLEEFYFTQHAPPPEASAFQRAQAAKEAVAVLSPMTDTMARGTLLTQVAQRFGVSEEELRRLRPNRPPRSGPSSADQPRSRPGQQPGFGGTGINPAYARRPPGRHPGR